jgi:hypothetical protein
MNRLLTGVKRFYTINIASNSTFPTSPGSISYPNIQNNTTTVQIPPTTSTSLTSLISPRSQTWIAIAGNPVLRSMYPTGNYGAYVQHNTLYQSLAVTINGV